jgi:hypothetical protein
MKHAIWVGALLCLVLGGSVAEAAPALDTASTAAAIRAARLIGATEVPEAAIHLELARQELERADDLNGGGQRKRAQSYVARAEADANLAIVLYRKAVEQTAAEAAVERVQQLRLENQ